MTIIKPKKVISLQSENFNFDKLNDKYHFVDANLLVLKELCAVSKNNIYPKLFVEDSIFDIIKCKIDLRADNKKVIGICIGDGDPTLKNRFLRCGKIYPRSWGIQNYLELLKLLIQNEDIFIVLIGGISELKQLEFLRTKLDFSGHIMEFVGKTTIQESMAIAKRCNLVVGIDTGMQHIAAAVGTTTLSIFGPTNPLTHGAKNVNSYFIVNHIGCQYCYGTRKYKDCENRRCLNELKPKTVYLKIIDILK